MEEDNENSGNQKVYRQSASRRHLSLPEDAAKQVGSVFEVILLPAGEADIYDYAETLAKEKGFKDLTVDDVEKIIHQSRGVR